MLAMGMVAMDIAWGDVIQTLAEKPHPPDYILTTAMNLGVWLLALKSTTRAARNSQAERETPRDRREGARDLAHLVQPNGVLPIHPERVGRACRDLDLVKAMDGLIETFRKTQDYYHRNNTPKRC